MTYGSCPADPLDLVRTNGHGPSVYAHQATTRLYGPSVALPSHLWMSVDELYAIGDGAAQDPRIRFRQLGHTLTIHTEDPSEVGPELARIDVALTEDVCLDLISVALSALRGIREHGR